jgi:hypothetical protein
LSAQPSVRGVGEIMKSRTVYLFLTVPVAALTCVFGVWFSAAIWGHPNFSFFESFGIIVLMWGLILSMAVRLIRDFRKLD